MFLSFSTCLVSAIIRSTICINCSFVNASNATISSTLFKNSGLNKSFNAPSILFFEASVVPPNPIEFVFKFEPAFDVIITIVFSKLTVFPCASVSLPSSNTCNKMLNTSWCAFSISSNKIIEYGFLFTLSVNWPASSYPTYPGGAPINFAVELLSIYSDISNLIIDFSFPNISNATAFASSVLPTPVGPTNIKDGGLFVLFSPALFLLIALATASTASSWPIILLWRFLSKFNNFCVSSSVILFTGIFVQLSITFAMSWTVISFGFILFFNASICSNKAHSFVFSSAAFW